MSDLSEASAGLLVTMKTAAMFSAFVTTPSDPAEFIRTEEEKFAALEPGTLQYLHPGETITFAEPPRVTEFYSEFYYRELCNIAASLGLTYESISADTSRSNYSSSRLAANNARRRSEALQFGVIVPQLLAPLWRRWIEIAIALGQIPGGDLAQNRADFLRCAWHPPAWPSVDPAKEMTATLAALSAGLKSRTQAAAELGLDIETLDREIAADAARAVRLGLSFSAPSVTPTPED
jgi:lambda family phage portal protein